MSNLRFIGMCIFIMSFITSSVTGAYCYDVDVAVYSAPVHQYITQQAAEIWTTPEILDHINRNTISDSLDLQCHANFDSSDDILIGSGEEDKEKNELTCLHKLFPPYAEYCPSKNEGLNGYFEHFWDPDFPRVGNFNCGTGGKYNKGISSIKVAGHFDSSYRLAQWYWNRKIMPLYIEGKKAGNKSKVNEAYYWLGRVAHLLEDATVPAHVHLLLHDPFIGGSDLYESFVTNHFETQIVPNFYGAKYSGQEYRYKNLFDVAFWNKVYGSPNPPNLFKLFYYTAQKTQYFASKGEFPNWISGAMEGVSKKGNDYYYDWDKTSPNKFYFNPSLWEKEAAIIVSEPAEVETNLFTITSALIPHAMKAVAGLYRLFWIETNYVTVLSPNGGEVLRSGSKYSVKWRAPAQAVKFDLMYSLNNKQTWTLIKSDITDTNYTWTVPTPLNNKSDCLVKVIGYNSANVLVSSDRSDSTFTIEVVKLISPNGGEKLTSGSSHTTTWTTNASKRPVAKLKLYYTMNGGAVFSTNKSEPFTFLKPFQQFLVPFHLPSKPI
jgi:hypothetical protein